jgi:adenylate cyclase
VNLAHRLQDAARPAGSTVASHATVRRCQASVWTLQELPQLMVKGRVTPVSAFIVRPVSTDAVVRMS